MVYTSVYSLVFYHIRFYQHMCYNGYNGMVYPHCEFIGVPPKHVSEQTKYSGPFTMVSHRSVLSGVILDFFGKYLSQLLHRYFSLQYIFSAMWLDYTFITMLALVRCMASVYSQVFFLIIILCKTFVTMAALKWIPTLWTHRSGVPPKQIFKQNHFYNV